MTQEEKQLLLKDLCSRLPYGVKLFHNLSETPVTFNSGHLNQIGVYKIKPYLRSLSSMTEKEKREYINLSDLVTVDGVLVSSSETFDWLISHHFDYRGLIEKGLALEAPEGMYKIK